MSAIFAQFDVSHLQAAHLDTMQDQPQTEPGLAPPVEFREIRLPAKNRAHDHWGRYRGLALISAHGGNSFSGSITAAIVPASCHACPGCGLINWLLDEIR
jgi:hypothetical protein